MESYKVYSGSEYRSWLGNSGNICLVYKKNNFIGNNTHREKFNSEKFILILLKMN